MDGEFDGKGSRKTQTYIDLRKKVMRRKEELEISLSLTGLIKSHQVSKGLSLTKSHKVSKSHETFHFTFVLHHCGGGPVILALKDNV